jgi:hypothetical protein
MTTLCSVSSTTNIKFDVSEEKFGKGPFHNHLVINNLKLVDSNPDNLEGCHFTCNSSCVAFGNTVNYEKRGLNPFNYK